MRRCVARIHMMVRILVLSRRTIQGFLCQTILTTWTVPSSTTLHSHTAIHTFTHHHLDDIRKNNKREKNPTTTRISYWRSFRMFFALILFRVLVEFYFCFKLVCFIFICSFAWTKETVHLGQTLCSYVVDRRFFFGRTDEKVRHSN